mmetsp:Transcript_21844/g.47703  ORF Transcript_21844/g.47703 Transcript_21844/m.47703 type:complete len:291 (+) Transcript_21844:150-1022(+)
MSLHAIPVLRISVVGSVILLESSNKANAMHQQYYQPTIELAEITHKNSTAVVLNLGVTNLRRTASFGRQEKSHANMPINCPLTKTKEERRQCGVAWDHAEWFPWQHNDWVGPIGNAHNLEPSICLELLQGVTERQRPNLGRREAVASNRPKRGIAGGGKECKYSSQRSAETDAGGKNRVSRILLQQSHRLLYNLVQFSFGWLIIIIRLLFPANWLVDVIVKSAVERNFCRLITHVIILLWAVVVIIRRGGGGFDTQRIVDGGMHGVEIRLPILRRYRSSEHDRDAPLAMI